MIHCTPMLSGACTCGKGAVPAADALFAEVYVHASACKGPDVPFHAWALHMCGALVARTTATFEKAVDARGMTATAAAGTEDLCRTALVENRAVVDWLSSVKEELTRSSNLAIALFAVVRSVHSDHGDPNPYVASNDACMETVQAAQEYLHVQKSVLDGLLPGFVPAPMQDDGSMKLLRGLWRLHRRWVVKSVVHIADADAPSAGGAGGAGLRLVRAGAEPRALDPVPGVVPPSPVHDAVGFAHLALDQMQAQARMMALHAFVKTLVTDGEVMSSVAKSAFEPALIVCRHVLARYAGVAVDSICL